MRIMHRITYENALELAKKHNVTDILYPLFVRNIGTLLCQPTNDITPTEAATSAEHQNKEELRANLLTTGQNAIGQSPGMQLIPMGIRGRQNVTDPELEVGLSESDVETLEDGSGMRSPSESSEASSSFECYLETRKRQIVDRVISHTVKWLRIKLFLAKRAAGLADNNSDQGGGSLRQTSTGKESGKSRENKKRDHESSSESGGESGKEADDGDKSHQNEKEGKGKAAQSRMIPKLACPYYKYDPDTYKSWRTCPGPGWDDVHRVKYSCPSPHFSTYVLINGFRS